MRNTLRLLAGLLIRGGKHRHRIFNKLLLPLGDLVLAEVMAPTQFCLRTFTAECLKNDLRFKLGGEGSSFSFRHRNSPFCEIVLYHNLGLDSGLNFRWQYSHTEGVSSLVFSSDGSTLISGSQDDTIRLWDVATGELKQTLEGHRDDLASVALSPDGATLASGDLNAIIHLWDTTTWTIK